MSARAGLSTPLAELLAELGLDASLASLGRRPAGGAADYLVLPSPSQPQLLVPLAPAGADLVLERRSRTLPSRLAKTMVAAGIRAGILRVLPVRRLTVGDPALDELVGWLGGRPGDRLGVLVGPPRANRKPVLRLLARDGSTTAFAKLGATPVTAALVRSEAAALAARRGARVDVRAPAGAAPVRELAWPGDRRHLGAGSRRRAPAAHRPAGRADA